MTQANRILLVEDDPLLSELLEMILLLEGLDVVPVANGLEALSQLKNDKFKLVILDLMMPLMDGLRFLEELAKDANDKPLVLVLSANSDAETADRARRNGAAAVARKPVDQEKFLGLVHQLLQQDSTDSRP